MAALIGEIDEYKKTQAFVLSVSTGDIGFFFSKLVALARLHHLFAVVGFS